MSVRGELGTGSNEFSEETESKDSLDARQDNHTPDAFFSPIQGVPLDVLHEIIVYCLPVHPTIQSASPVISTLSRVSSTWRTAVLWSPRPWSTLFVTIRQHDDLTECAQAVTRWFQRARSISLSFFLNVRFRTHNQDITRMRTFLADLSSVMLRVWHFGFHAYLTSPLLRSFVDLKWNLLRLKTLDLFSHSGWDRVKAVEFSSPLFQSAPNLVRVAIQNAITSAPDIQPILPWSQLTRIVVAYSISIPRWIEIMNMCPMLRSCDAALNRSDDTSLDSYLQQCTPHNLKRFDLGIDGLVPFLKPLFLYNLPSLATLHVHCRSEPFVGSPIPQDVSALRNLREFSFNPGSKRLSRDHLTYLAEVLREMVNLTVLRLQQATSDLTPLYEDMSFKTAEVPLLPQLNILQIWITTSSEVHLADKDEALEPLIEMVSSRNGEDNVPVGCSPLGKFTIGVEDEDIYERAKKRFGSWVGRLPQFEITLNRDFRFDQPEGWTYPLSE